MRVRRRRNWDFPAPLGGGVSVVVVGGGTEEAPFANEFGDTLCWYSAPEETVKVGVVGCDEGGCGDAGARGDVGVEGGGEIGDEALDVEYG